MATDSFTNTNATEIGAHTAGGNTWVGLNRTDPIGQIVSNQLRFGEYAGISARCSNSSSDFCQAVAKGGNYEPNTKSVHVRSSLTANGYQLTIGSIVGDTIEFIRLSKNEANLASMDITSMAKSRLVDHTLAIKATVSGSNIEIRGYIDGTQLTWDWTNADTEAPSLVYTDLAAHTPLSAGNPGITVYFEDGMVDANSGMDDFTDTESGGGGGSLLKSRGMNGGFIDMNGGLQ